MRYDDLLEAVRRPNNVFELVLQNQGLEALPAEVDDFKRLENIDLRGNPALNWPQTFIQLARLRGLVKLNLMNCGLEALPEQIALLRGLQYLYLDNNSLQTLPEEIGQLSELTNLSVDNNRLAHLPAGMFKLSALKFLSLNRNQLTEIPREIGELRQLITFHVKENPLTEATRKALPTVLPKSIFIFGQ